MKRIFAVLTVIACLAVILLAGTPGAAAGAMAYVVQAGNVITVYPTGEDDTANLQTAFDQAIAAGPGSTVQLEEGQFYTHLLFVENFDGYFKGMGQDKTFIDALPSTGCQELFGDQGYAASLFTFILGYARVSDMTFHITPESPCDPYAWPDSPNYFHNMIFAVQMMVTPFDLQTECFELGVEPLSASVTRITVIGEQGIDPNSGGVSFSNMLGGARMGGRMGPFYYDTAPEGCVYFGKMAQGDFRFVDNTVHRVMYGAAHTIITTNSSAELSHNTIDTVLKAIDVTESSNSKLEISHNRITNNLWTAIQVSNGGLNFLSYLQPSEFTFVDNEMEVYGNGNGIVAFDFENLGQAYPPNKTVILRARNNRLTLYPSNVWGFWLEGVEDAQITNNKVTGSSALAFIAGRWGPTDHALFNGNNISGFTSVLAGPLKVVLEAGTHDYVVTGVPPDQVLDLGTSNVISNTHSPVKGGIPPGLEALMVQKMETVKRSIR